MNRSVFKKIKMKLKEGFTVKKVKRLLPMMPYDKAFDVDGREELCHATGYEMFDGDVWWNEYIDSEGNYHYGN